MTPASSTAIISQLRTQYPTIMASLPHLRFIEQYDPADTSSSAQSQPYAYVTDKVAVHDLSIVVEDIISQGLPPTSWEAMAELRDNIAPGANIGWFVVYNGDPERAEGGYDSAGGLAEVCLFRRGLNIGYNCFCSQTTRRSPKEVSKSSLRKPDVNIFEKIGYDAAQKCSRRKHGRSFYS